MTLWYLWNTCGSENNCSGSQYHVTVTQSDQRRSDRDKQGEAVISLQINQPERLDFHGHLSRRPLFILATSHKHWWSWGLIPFVSSNQCSSWGRSILSQEMNVRDSNIFTDSTEQPWNSWRFSVTKSKQAINRMPNKNRMHPQALRCFSKTFTDWLVVYAVGGTCLASCKPI